MKIKIKVAQAHQVCPLPGVVVVERHTRRLPWVTVLPTYAARPKGLDLQSNPNTSIQPTGRGHPHRRPRCLNRRPQPPARLRLQRRTFGVDGGIRATQVNPLHSRRHANRKVIDYWPFSEVSLDRPRQPPPTRPPKATPCHANICIYIS